MQYDIPEVAPTVNPSKCRTTHDLLVQKSICCSNGQVCTTEEVRGDVIDSIQDLSRLVRRENMCKGFKGDSYRMNGSKRITIGMSYNEPSNSFVLQFIDKNTGKRKPQPSATNMKSKYYFPDISNSTRKIVLS
eukprot:GHVH01009401.1.p1 GENE.GHVH01009401.1~~GHVH01009401.1.p1  ORF type:complete len:133 (+),score=8.90 GHVH01009401.1:2-400(+)